MTESEKMNAEGCMYIDAATIEQIAEFSRKRNWTQFHTPKDLAISISLEGGSILSVFSGSVGICR